MIFLHCTGIYILYAYVIKTKESLNAESNHKPLVYSNDMIYKGQVYTLTTTVPSWGVPLSKGLFQTLSYKNFYVTWAFDLNVNIAT